MTSPTTPDLVEGEPLRLIAEALLQLDLKEQPDGMWSLTTRLEPGIGDSFVRALMRVEARLMLEDADQVGRPGAEHRTHEQRGADALVQLITSVANQGQGGDPRRAGR